jgi:transposase
MLLLCPNLNPIERLWKVMNEHVRNNKYFATAKNLEKN